MVRWGRAAPPGDPLSGSCCWSALSRFASCRSPKVVRCSMVAVVEGRGGGRGAHGDGPRAVTWRICGRLPAPAVVWSKPSRGIFPNISSTFINCRLNVSPISPRQTLFLPGSGQRARTPGQAAVSLRPPGKVHLWPPATSEFLQGRWSNHWCVLWFSRRVLQGSHFSCGGHSLYGHLVFPGMFTLLGFTVFLGRASQYLLQLFLVTVPTPGCLASRGARRNLKIRRRDFREVGQ